MNFSEFKNCQLSTDQIVDDIKMFDKEEQSDILRFIYALLFHVDIKLENKIDLRNMISAYLSYKQGNYAIVKI